MGFLDFLWFSLRPQVEIRYTQLARMTAKKNLRAGGKHSNSPTGTTKETGQPFARFTQAQSYYTLNSFRLLQNEQILRFARH
jgi:hypothetical protein